MEERGRIGREGRQSGWAPIRDCPGTVIHDQSLKDIKTQADVDAEDLIRSRLASSAYPVVGEELANDVPWDSAGPVWIVDPLDGTANYVRGFPVHVVSIALYSQQAPLFGVVYDFVSDRLYAGGDHGLRVDGEACRTSSVADMGQSILATGFPTHRTYDEASLLRFVSQVAKFKKIRMIGSAAMSLALVASGVFDAYFEEDIMIWDVAAGLALVLAAGGEISISKKSVTNRVDVIATNGQLSCAEVAQSEPESI